MQILNLSAVVPEDKIIKIFDINNVEQTFYIPGRLPTELMFENLEAGRRLKSDPSDFEAIEKTFEVIWKIFAIRQPDLTFKDFRKLPLNQDDLARVITFIYNTATPDIAEEKKTV